jgi:glycosyltransferase involved in cell wall biosynthesis
VSHKISVITPVFNGVRFMEFCIRNVIGQNCPDAEHIIVDGGSTDGTVEIIRKYAQEYPHIRWVSEKDKGQSDAMNKGIAMATGEIIGFLNVDDYYEPGALREALALFDGLPEPSLLVGNCNVWDNDGKLWLVNRPARISLKNLLHGLPDTFPLNPSAYFYHRSLHERIGPYETDEHYGMDVHFIFRAAQQAKVTYVDRNWGNYRYLEGTKTYEDDKCGGNEPRVKRITEQYRRSQPLYYRLYLAAVETWGKIARFVHNPPSGAEKR